MLLEELYQYIGQKVTIFTTSGGASGYGFTGVLLRVNPTFITLVNRLGAPPVNSILDVKGNDRRNLRATNGADPVICTVGSMCDIPTDKIAAFSHNAA